MTKPNLDRMRKYAAGKPVSEGAVAVAGLPAPKYSPDATVIRDAVGRVVRVIEPKRG